MNDRRHVTWRRFLARALLVGAALIALAACGGDDGGGYTVALLVTGTHLQGGLDPCRLRRQDGSILRRAALTIARDPDAVDQSPNQRSTGAP